MKNKRWFIVFAAALLFVGIAGAYVNATIAPYRHAAPCGKLSGFAGVLQAANLVPVADCTVDVKKGGCHDSRVCNISDPPTGKKKTGHCQATTDGQGCVCVAD